MKYHVEMTVFVGMDIEVPDYVEGRSQEDIETWIREQANEMYYDTDGQVSTYIDYDECNYKHRIVEHTLSRNN